MLLDKFSPSLQGIRSSSIKFFQCLRIVKADGNQIVNFSETWVFQFRIQQHQSLNLLKLVFVQESESFRQMILKVRKLKLLQVLEFVLGKFDDAIAQIFKVISRFFLKEFSVKEWEKNPPLCS